MLQQRPIKYLTLFAICLICTAILLIPGGRAVAHPANMYYQTSEIILKPQEILVEWKIFPGTMYAPAAWNEADSNMDGEINSAEGNAWAETKLSDILIVLDGSVNLDCQLVAAEWPDDFADIEIKNQPILLNIRASLPIDIERIHQFKVKNIHYKGVSLHWYTVHGVDGIVFLTPEQNNEMISFEFMPQDFSQLETSSPEATETNQLVYWDSGTPGLDGSFSSPEISEEVEMEIQPVEPPAENQPLSSSGILTKLSGMLETSTTNYLLILGTALFLGGIHALTPGHGKALVAAYLVGSKGTPAHAAALGGIVTLTHTGSVLLIGAITLLASHYFLPSILLPGMELISSGMIIIIGIIMIRRGWLGFRGIIRSRRQSQKPPEEFGKRIIIGEQIATRVYDDVLPPAGASLSRFGWRSILSLGISGGLVPCPDAIAILFIAARINRFGLGISLILAFSLGMALVLIIIGIAFVRGRKILEGFTPIRNLSNVIPLFSGFVVLGLGAVIMIGALNSTGFQMAIDSIGVPAQATSVIEPDEVLSQATETAEADKVFNIDTASVLFLGRDEEKQRQLYRFNLSEGKATQLTDVPFGLMEYTLSPDGTAAAYLIINEGVIEMWSLDIEPLEKHLLISFENIICNGIVWSPDGNRIVYQVLYQSPVGVLGFASLRWFEPETGEQDHIFQDSQFPSFSAFWSPNGEWLGYLSQGLNTVLHIYNLQDGTGMELPSRSGRTPEWSPDSETLLLTDIRGEGENKTMHLLSLDLQSGQYTDLNRDEGYQDRFAAWSSDGSWIAVVRMALDSPDDSFGDQIWLMKPDGSERRQITNVEDFIHGNIFWSPDDKFLVYDGFSLGGGNTHQSIWILEIESGEITQIAPSGAYPAWLP